MDRKIALREWAVAVKALEEGKQIVALRKGGIAEETKEFRLESPSFYLFSSYEHQQPELVKPEFRDVVALTRKEWESRPDRVMITSYAEAAEDLEVTDADTLSRIDSLHIWTENYAEERLRWKRTKPLHVLLLRVFMLEEPIVVPMREQYGGCKSWLRLEETLPERAKKPALDDEDFRSMSEAVKRALATKTIS
ncbi:DUF1802 domain-containing protein [Cohnella lubricantis]|uniref:DUF1802 family protein n=1 Tax=Cohnella lubricantis TaxID=2163172 RepID=A0A841T967_9BACL|nr:DUF1802 family protein [Cohnella lubricantis]MBB6677482.1 DUF1802 family protein [Cohnella lubricantis]MBP2116632.1 hypothetical protein [Cohnella lubricantis]